LEFINKKGFNDGSRGFQPGQESSRELTAFSKIRIEDTADLPQTNLQVKEKGAGVSSVLPTSFSQDCDKIYIFRFAGRTPLSMSDSREKWGPIAGEQGGESGAFRAPKGQVFPACEPRQGHFGSVGAKRQGCSPKKSGNSRPDYILFRAFALFQLF